MPVFQYKGINSKGEEVKSTISCESMPVAKQKLKGQKIMLLDISEQKGKSDKKSSTKSFSFFNKVSVQELSLMTRQLATLSKARIPLVQALDALIDQTEHPYLKMVLSDVKQKVNEGASLAKSLGEYPKIFDQVYCNMVEAGEASGTLSLVLARLADFSEAQVKLRNKIKGAMTYPVIMMVVGTGMMLFIFTFVIPKISKIFVSMKKQMPPITRISIGISDFLIEYKLVLPIVVFLLVVGLKKYIAGPSGKAKWHALMLRLPVIKPLVVMINVSRFASTLATLLSSGVPILTALSIVKNLVSNVHMQQAIVKCRESVSEGASMTGPLIKSTYYPPMVTHMIRLGEKSGELESMLQIVAESYEDQVESRLTGLASILEPIMMIFLGIAVGFIVFSVVMPLMELNKIR